MIRTIEVFQVKFCDALSIYVENLRLFIFDAIMREHWLFAVNNLFPHSLQKYLQ